MVVLSKEKKKKERKNKTVHDIITTTYDLI